MPNIPPEQPAKNGQSVFAVLQEALRDLPNRLHASLGSVDGHPGDPPQGRRAAAVLAVLAWQPEPSLLFTLRPQTMRSHAGQVSFPGGHVEEGESYLAAALRETREEVGIVPEDLAVAGWLPPVWTGGSDFWVIPYLATCEQRPAITPNVHEVEEAFWLPIGQLADAHRHTACPVQGQDMRFVIDYWDVETDRGKRTIWGATGAMLRSFLEGLAGIELPQE